jgi:hypothetical protein
VEEDGGGGACSDGIRRTSITEENIVHRRHFYLALALSTFCDDLLRSRTTTNRGVHLLHVRSPAIFLATPTRDSFAGHCSRPFLRSAVER